MSKTPLPEYSKGEWCSWCYWVVWTFSGDRGGGCCNESFSNNIIM